MEAARQGGIGSSCRAAPACPAWPGVRLYLGGDAYCLQGRRFAPTGHRMFSAAWKAKAQLEPAEVPLLDGILDSGAFTDVRKARLDPAAALLRQLAWEVHASQRWGAPFMASALVSYDQLIDEKLVAGRRVKQRWNVAEADAAVRVTVEAAAYLASHRERLLPRRLLLACQGVDAQQQLECATEILRIAAPGDGFGLGGWCILGRNHGWLPTFWSTLHRLLPLVAAAGLSWVHIFGVGWEVALGGLLWLAHLHGLRVSTDTSRPALDLLWKNPNKAKHRRPEWEDNVAWWRHRLATLQSSPFFRAPPDPDVRRQSTLFPLS